ncbi:MAG: radical SAM protein [Candidatus Limnocylindrales bacterium]
MDPLDRLGRPLRDLRISVTDRCNFRCTYCMPKEIFGRDYAFLPRDQVLSFEEIVRAARVFVSLGVEKLRITGGEPLVRRDLPELIAMLAGLRTPDGRELDLTLTTNGAALRALAAPTGLGRTPTRDGQPGLPRRRGVRGDERDRLPGIAGAGWGRRCARCRSHAAQGQHGRAARDQRVLGRADGALGSRDRCHVALHRIYGCRTFQWLATR